MFHHPGLHLSRPCQGDERIGLARVLTEYKRITVHTVSFLIDIRKIMFKKIFSKRGDKPFKQGMVFWDCA
jgi:hypothetical protein